MKSSTCELSYLMVAAAGLGLYVWVWAGTLQSAGGPPTAGKWALVYLGLMAAIGMLGFLRRGRVLLTVVGLVAVLMPGATAARAGTAPAFAALAWLTLISAGLGALLLRPVRPAIRCSSLEQVTLSLLLGFGALALVTTVLAQFGLLRTEVAVPTLVLLTLPIAVRVWRLGPQLRRDIAGARTHWLEADLRLPALGLACLELCFAPPFLWAVAPSVHFDALMYHLAVPATYAARHGLVQLPDVADWFFIGQAHLLYALAFVLGGEPLPELEHLGFGLMTTALVFSLARRLAGSVAGWTAAIGFASMPLVSWEAGTAYIDLFVTTYTFASLYALIRAWDREELGWLMIAGVLAGIAMSTKQTAALLLTPAALFGIVVVLVQYRRLATASPRLLAPFLVLALLPLPWLVRSWSSTSGWASYLLGRILQPPIRDTGPWARFGTGTGLIDYLRLPYDLVVHGPRFDEVGFGALGAIPFVALTALLAGGDVSWRLRGPLFFVGIGGLALWFRTAQISRYLLPAAPLLAVLAALALPSLLRIRMPRAGPRWLPATCLVLGLVYVAATRGLYSFWGFQIPEAYPYRYALGQETRDEFLARALRPYRAFQFIDAHGGSAARILTDRVPFRLLHLNGQLDDDDRSAVVRGLARLGPGQELADELIRLGDRFIVVDWFLQRQQPIERRPPFIDLGFLHRYGHLEFAYRDVYVYGLGAGQFNADVTGSDLVSNGGFDVPPDRDVPPGWVPFGAPRLERDASQARSAPMFAQVTHDDGFYQQFPANPGSLYTVRLQARAPGPEQAVWLQILWLDPDGRILDTGITSFRVEREWQPFEASLTAVHPETAFGFVYARAAPGSWVWVDDVSLVTDETGASAALEIEAHRLVDAGQFDRAIPMLEGVLGQNASNAEAQYLLAFCLHNLGIRLPEALERYDEALGLGYAEFWVRYNRGGLLLKLGDRDLARRDLLRARELDPNHPGVTVYLEQLDKP